MGGQGEAAGTERQSPAQGLSPAQHLSPAQSQGVSFDTEWLDNVSRKASIFSKRLSTMLRGYGTNGPALLVSSIRPAPRDTAARLSKRELEVLSNLAQGFTRQDIADANSISVNTAKSTITNVYNKLGAINRADAVRIAASMGILD
jgi:LuxR family maltose regulon positive regulatory protein